MKINESGDITCDNALIEINPTRPGLCNVYLDGIRQTCVDYVRLMFTRDDCSYSLLLGRHLLNQYDYGEDPSNSIEQTIEITNLVVRTLPDEYNEKDYYDNCNCLFTSRTVQNQLKEKLL